MWTEEDIKRFLELIEFYQLEYPVEMNQMSIFELRSICNGIGPDNWPDELRKISTMLFGPYAVLHVPHDVRFEKKIGTREQADREFYDNGIRIWKIRWGAWRYFSWQAIKEWLTLRAAYKLLSQFSKKAWES